MTLHTPRLFSASLLLVCVVIPMLWLSFLPQQVVFTNQITESVYWTDRTLTATQPEQLPQTGMKAFSGPLYLGNDHRPLWVRLTVPPLPENTEWVLKMQPNYTHQLTVFTAQPQVIGMKWPFSERQRLTLSPAVDIQPHPDRATTLYVRVDTPTTPLSFQVVSARENNLFNTQTLLVVGILTGFGLLLMTLSSVMYAITRDRLWAFDAGYNFLGLWVMAYQMNVVGAFLLPSAGSSVTLGFHLMLAIFVTYTHVFFIQLFRLMGVSERWLWVNRAYALLVLPILWLIVQGQIDHAMALNNLSVALSAAWGLVMWVKSRQADRLIFWSFRIGYGILIAVFFAWALPVVGQWQTGSTSPLYPQIPLSVFTMLLLVTVLGRNTWLTWQTHEQEARDRHALAQSLASAHQHHEDTQRFLGLLMHEIKNPLGTLSLSVANLNEELHAAPAAQLRLSRMQQAVAQIDQVLRRGVAIDQLVSGAVTLQRDSVVMDRWLHHVMSQQPELKRFIVETTSFSAQIDTDLLLLMLDNLLSNARTYSPPESMIQVVLSEDSLGWSVSVRNRLGKAGAPDPERLFQKYYRASAAMRHSGLGLGLYWVRGLAQLMGGDVRYTRHDQDVEFTLWLPH